MRSGLQFGWNPSLCIPLAVQRVDPTLVDAWYALVSVVDSTPHVRQLPSLASLLLSISADHREVEDDVAVPGAVLRSLIDEHHFFPRFDEIYLFPELPTRGKPASITITSDAPFGSRAPSGLAEWMQLAGCIAGLGDGIGLNFATFDHALATLWQV